MLEKQLIVYEIKLLLNTKLQELNIAIENCKESIFNEQKSSAGDKYETGRAMAQIQLEMLEKQLNELISQLDFFNRIDFNKKHKVISVGSVVKTDTNIYFICVGIGNIKVENNDILCISSHSPIAKQLIDKVVNDEIDFNRKIQKIEDFI